MKPLKFRQAIEEVVGPAPYDDPTQIGGYVASKHFYGYYIDILEPIRLDQAALIRDVDLILKHAADFPKSSDVRPFSEPEKRRIQETADRFLARYESLKSFRSLTSISESCSSRG